MNIKNLQSGVDSFTLREKFAPAGTLGDINKSETTNSDKETVEAQRGRHKPGRPDIENMQRLSPFDQYRYLDGQKIQSRPVSLRVIPGNPQKTLSLANNVINEAIMPPVFANPSRNKLSEAMQLKRMAESLIDKAA